MRPAATLGMHFLLSADLINPNGGPAIPGVDQLSKNRLEICKKESPGIDRFSPSSLAYEVIFRDICWFCKTRTIGARNRLASQSDHFRLSIGSAANQSIGEALRDGKEGVCRSAGAGREGFGTRQACSPCTSTMRGHSTGLTEFCSRGPDMDEGLLGHLRELDERSSQSGYIPPR